MKIGRNDPCPCKSGKKYKKCCMNKAEDESGKRHFEIKGRKAEEVVQEIAQKSFFTDWCYLNPKSSNGKEICDLLIIYDEVAVIWQVKDLKINKKGHYNQGEVEKNLRQLLGAKRQLFEFKKSIKLENPRRGKELFDPEKIKQIYLIAVQMGEGEEYSSFMEEVKDNQIHIFTRKSIPIILDELDTISDFIEYLKKKEEFMAEKDLSIILMGGEEELLGWYLFNNRSFERLLKSNVVLMEEGIWEKLKMKPEYIEKKKQDKISYCWDGIVNRAHTGSTNYEKVARELARPNRFERRYLAKGFLHAWSLADKNNTYPCFRRVCVGKNITYCFLFQDDFSEKRENRQAQLGTMCFVARADFGNSRVIGIATEKKIRKICSYDFCLLDIPDWTEQQQKKAEQIKTETGMLQNINKQVLSEDEYPKV